MVNPQDEAIGVCEKNWVHEAAILHRAVSVVLWDDEKFFLQKRGYKKYHSPNIWSNAACTHPSIEETCLQAAERALKQELNIENIPLTYIGAFIYREEVSDNMYEHEYDHTYLGQIPSDFSISPNIEEVDEYKWIDMNELDQQLVTNPQEFSAWLPHLWNFIKCQNAFKF